LGGIREGSWVRIEKNTSKKYLLKFGRMDLALTFALPIETG
jgi:hypothetical protein